MTTTIAFTGIPGAGLHPHVEKTARSVEGSLGVSILTVSIDDLVWRCFARAARNNAALRAEVGLASTEVSNTSQPNWWHFLRLPVELVRS